MRPEVHSASQFLMNLLRVKQSHPLPDSQLQNFKGSLEDLLILRYSSHWYPEVPIKGSGYRCIRINGKMDPIIEQAGVAVGLHPRTLKKMLPQELTMWIDPDEVSYRIGENGSICILYDTVDTRASPSSDLDSTGSGVGSEELKLERISDLSRNHNSSLSSSGGQLTPPLSPPYHHSNHRYNSSYQMHHHHNQQQHQQHHNHHHHHHHNHHNNNQHHHQQQNSSSYQHFNNSYMDNQLYHWDGFNSFNNNKVGTESNLISRFPPANKLQHKRC